MHDIDDLVRLNDNELSRIGLGELNIACGIDLPGAEEIDYFECLGRLAEWIDLIRQGTAHMWSKYPKYQREFGATESQFKIWVMVTILRRNLGIGYDFKQLEELIDLSDSRPRFIHGLLMGFGGSCVSLPMLYAAVGRGLGYPLKLALAKEHIFVRWEGVGERFNIEATCDGFAPTDDSHYHEHPRPLTDKDLAKGFYLRNLTPREELSQCLAERALCLLDNLQTAPANGCFSLADKVAPEIGVLNHGNWAGASLLHETIMRVHKRALTLQDEALVILIESSIPAPRHQWERQAAPLVREHLRRLLALHKVRCRPLRLPGYKCQSEIVPIALAPWTVYA